MPMDDPCKPPIAMCVCVFLVLKSNGDLNRNAQRLMGTKIEIPMSKYAFKSYTMKYFENVKMQKK